MLDILVAYKCLYKFECVEEIVVTMAWATIDEWTDAH